MFRSIIFGYLDTYLYVGIASDLRTYSLLTFPNHVDIVDAHFGVPLIIKQFPIIITIVASFTAIYLYQTIPTYLISITNNYKGYKFYKFFNGKYLIEVIYNYYNLNTGNHISIKLDIGLIELIAPHALSYSITTTSNNISVIDTGNIKIYDIYNC